MEQWNELIDRIIQGEVGLDHPDVQEAASDPDFLEQLDETQRILGALDEGAILDEIRSEGPEEDHLGIEALVNQHLSERNRPNPFKRRAFLYAAAAAAALLTATPRLLDTFSNSDPIMLGAEGFVGLTPKGAGADFSKFTWTAAGPGGSYRVKVYDDQGILLANGDSEYLGDTLEWPVDPELKVNWEHAAVWIVTWKPNGNGKPVEAETHASL